MKGDIVSEETKRKISEEKTKPYKVVMILGMPLHQWEVDSCVAHFGIGDLWATLYDIESLDKQKGHATKLLTEAKAYYEKQGKVVGGSIALHPAMQNLYKKLNIIEYTEDIFKESL